MSNKYTDELGGRAKEAAGALSGNDDLKREGKTDQASASLKDAADSAKDGAHDAIDAVKDTVNNHKEDK